MQFLMSSIASIDGAGEVFFLLRALIFMIAYKLAGIAIVNNRQINSFSLFSYIMFIVIVSHSQKLFVYCLKVE